MLTATPPPRGREMRRSLESIALLVTFIALLGCGTSPTAPGQTGPPEFDPAALLAKLAGPYTLTFEADESCALPPSPKVLSYNVFLSRSPYRYLSVRVADKNVVGDLWLFGREEEGFTLRWNVDCEVPDTVGSTSFYLCGEGAAFATDDATISGVLRGGNVYLDIDHRPLCTSGAHRFVFQRRN
jgi:hypothetical protein